jgi:F-type H+-transporting ATPase subunit alpha
VANLVQEIEAQIAGANPAAAWQNVGVIREIGDGVAKIEGLTDAMLNEMIDLGHGITGLALNLEETEVGVIILGDYTQLEEGSEARTTGKLLQVPVGKSLLGRVVNTLGEPLDGKGPIQSDVAYPVEKLAPGIIRRQSVNQPLQTGIMPVDAMIPIASGNLSLAIDRRGRRPSALTRSSAKRG